MIIALPSLSSLSKPTTPGSIGRAWLAALLLRFSGAGSEVKDSSQQPPAKDWKIVLADDDEDDCEIFEEAILKVNNGISLHKVNNGISLINQLEQETLPDLIFLDLNMPGKNGKECLAEIRQHPRWKKIPVLIYSTSANNRDVSETYSAGATMYLVKPTSFQKLLTTMKKVLAMDLVSTQLPEHKFLFSK